MGSFSLVHWLVVLGVLLLVFGPKKLASVGKGLGQGIRNFKTGLTEDEDTARLETDADEPKRIKRKRS